MTQEQCSEAKTGYKDSTDKKFELQTLLDNRIQEVSKIPGMTTYGLDGIVANLKKEYQTKLNPIDIDIARYTRDMNLYCY